MYTSLFLLSLIIASLLFAFFNNTYLTIQAIHSNQQSKFLKTIIYQVINILIIFAFLLMLLIFLQYKNDILEYLSLISSSPSL